MTSLFAITKTPTVAQNLNDDEKVVPWQKFSSRLFLSQINENWFLDIKFGITWVQAWREGADGT